MSIIRMIKQFRELSRLKKAARRTPSPASIGALAERFIALGRNEDAYRVADAALRSFPTSERILAVRNFAQKQRLQAEIRKLRSDISERPSPTSYTRLAEIYRELGNYDQALTICGECIERFPLNENPYLIFGEIRLIRFMKDLIALDGIEAEKQLRRVAKLNSQNLKAHLLLAHLYHCVGAIEPLKEHMRLAIELSPEARELEKFLHEVEARPAAEPVPVEPDEDEDDWFDETEATVTDRIRRVEETCEFRHRPDECPAFRLLPRMGGVGAARLDMENLKLNLKEIGGRTGVENAVIMDRDGEALADCSEADALTRKQFSELVSEILRTSEDTSRRMDVGTFHWCTVEGAFGGITIAKVKSISIGMKYDGQVRPDRAHEMLQEFAARNFTAQPEVARA